MPRLSWLEAATSGGLSPMQLLVAWLTRHYATFSSSTAAAKQEMLQELCQGMRDAGLDCSVSAIRSKIDRLKREARGQLRPSRSFVQYQETLMRIFSHADENRHELRGQEGDEAEPVEPDGSINAPFVVDEQDTGANRGRSNNRRIDSTEIRRRFELLCARHELQRRGIDEATIDQALPLP